MSEKKDDIQGNFVINYLKGAYAEMRKVTWPTKEETWKKSLIVVWFSLGFAVFLGTIDYALNKIIEIVL